MADADTDDRPDVDAILAPCDLKCELSGRGRSEGNSS